MNYQLVRTFGRNTVVGGLFLLTVAFVGAIGTFITGENLRGDLSDLGSAFSTLNFLQLGWIFISFVLIGLLVYVWTRASTGIGKMFGLKTQKGIGNLKKDGKIVLLSLFFLGILTSVIIYGFASFMRGLVQNPNFDITSLASLQTGLASGNILMLLGTLVSIAGIGYIIVAIGNRFPAFEKKAANPVA